MSRAAGWTGWVDLIAPNRWPAYERVLRELNARQIKFALGGGIATATHSGFWHETKDLDFYILPEDRERVIELTAQLGLADIHSELPYDHSWTYRSTDGNIVVEAIWAMRNHRATVDCEWLRRSEEVNAGGLHFRVAAVEEMIWHKLYVVMKERCDWPDVLNCLYTRAGSLDWSHLLDRLGEDKPLLASALVLFSWISPDLVSTVPSWVWNDLGLRISEGGSAADGLRRAALLSTYNWYGPMADGVTLERSR